MFLFRWFILAIVFLLLTQIFPGIHVAGFGKAFLAAAVLSLVNVFIKPAVIILTLPVNILTLGLFTFVVNALMLWLVSAIVPGFTIVSFWWAFIVAAIVTAVKWMIP